MNPEAPDKAKDRAAEFASTLVALLGDQTAQRVLATMQRPKRQGFWVNPLKPLPQHQLATAVAELEAQPVLLARQLSDEQRLGETGLALDNVPASSTGLWWVAAEHREALVRHPLTTAGHLYPINPSSVWAAEQLPLEPGHEVLDLAAAPGGKTLLMAAALNANANRVSTADPQAQGAAEGRIAAVEPVAARFHRMRANLERCGVQGVRFYQADGRGVGAKVGERFDAVLLDAPCSSEARVRLAEPATLAHWSPRKIRETQRKQKRLLLSGFAALKPGGRLLYCTCAFSFAENEAVLLHLLKREPRASLQPVEVPATAHWLSGFTQDPQRRRKVEHPAMAHAVRILPDDLWDGFFMALVRKDG